MIQGKLYLLFLILKEHKEKPTTELIITGTMHQWIFTSDTHDTSCTLSKKY